MKKKSAYLRRHVRTGNPAKKKTKYCVCIGCNTRIPQHDFPGHKNRCSKLRRKKSEQKGRAFPVIPDRRGEATKAFFLALNRRTA